MNEDQKPKKSTEDNLKKLEQLSYQAMRTRFMLGRRFNEAVDEVGVEEVIRECAQPDDPNWALPRRVRSLAVLCRHKPLDDWNEDTIANDIFQAMKAEHELYKSELPDRIRVLLLAYEQLVEEYVARTERLVTSSKSANTRISELYLQAYQVLCPTCESEDVEPLMAMEGKGVFRCRACRKYFSE